MNDKSKQLKVSLNYLNDKLHCEGYSEGNSPISIDYIPPLGDNLGYTSLELLLLSFSSCVANTLLIFLRKMKKDINDLKVEAIGERKEEHPTGFKTIILSLEFHSDNMLETDIEKVLQLSEEAYCPVWSMLKGNVEVKVNYNILKS